MNSISPPRRMKELAVSAMLGTDRNASLQASSLLDGAAAAGLQARAGIKTTAVSQQLPLCGVDNRPLASEKQMAILIRALNEPDRSLIEEWSVLAHAKGLRVADAAAPMLLDWWAKQDKREEVVFALLGVRGTWLASLHAAWRKPVARGEVPERADELWLTSSGAERAALLKTIRRVDPKRAMNLVRSTWNDDGAEERRKFIEICSEKCSMEDEPFLEEALDDKSKLVRRAATQVLASIPGSRFAQRMRERAKGMIRVETKRVLLKQRTTLRLEPPQDFDSSWERDGIEEKPANGVGKRAWWLKQVFSLAPLSMWTETVGKSPEDVIEAMAGDDFFDTALEALSVAASTHGDPAWCGAIVHHKSRSKKGLDWSALRELTERLPIASRESITLKVMHEDTMNGAAAWDILGSCDWRWSKDFSISALKKVRGEAVGKKEEWRVHTAASHIARCIAAMHAEQFAEAVMSACVEELPPSCRKSIDRAHLRSEMYKEFAR